MSDWAPTMTLRCVERLDRNLPPGAQVVRTVQILQQQWTRIVSGYGVPEREFEWRDVPVEQETRSHE